MSKRGRKRLSEEERKNRVCIQIKHTSNRDIFSRSLIIKGFTVEEVHYRVLKLFRDLEKMKDGEELKVVYYKNKRRYKNDETAE